MPSAKHAQGKKNTTLWIDENILKQFDEVAAEKGIPRSIMLENMIREKIGMPPIEPSPFTPHSKMPNPKKKAKK